jgi:hypothetical protein
MTRGQLDPVRLSRAARRELNNFTRSLEKFNAHIPDEQRNGYLDDASRYLIALRRVRGLPDAPAS